MTNYKILKAFRKQTKDDIPSFLCLILSLGWLGSAVPISIFSQPFQPIMIILPVVFGLFFFLLSLILDLDTKYRKLKKGSDNKDVEALKK